MSKIWDDLKSNVKDWSNAAVEKAEEVSKVAVAKTEELTKLSKIKLTIHQLQRDKGKEFLLLGKLAYNHSKEANMSNFTGNTEFFAHIEKIDSLSEKILEKEKEIETIKSETVSSEDNLSVTNSNEEESYKEESSPDVFDIEEIKLPGDDK
ncbi:MAG: hypothetical protein VX924_03340 [Candidatus Neomarinimicrobiota bacterium]|nr:hypothetical protein [Candidatus Neomarinimicrobiota bacterium]